MSIHTSISLLPRVGVVIPVKGHPAFLDEAIASVLVPNDMRLYGPTVIVIDGCPYAQTLQTAKVWQAALGPDLHVIEQENRGLSAARNRGIELLLTEHDDLEAVFLLDADNRLAQGAFPLFFHMLKKNPEVDWFYPHFDMFGQYSNTITPDKAQLLMHARYNMCEAGSLVRTKAFTAGVRFSEELKSGFEDWDFWLQLHKAGFQGKLADGPMLEYRRRPASMVSKSEEMREQLEAELRKRHAWLFDRDTLVALEHESFPRYALIQDDPSFVKLAVDPDDAKEVTAGHLVRMIAAHLCDPYANPVPHMFVFGTQRAWENIKSARMTTGLLWTLERSLARDPNLDYVEVGLAEQHETFSILASNPDINATADILAISAARFFELLRTSADQVFKPTEVEKLNGKRLVVTTPHGSTHELGQCARDQLRTLISRVDRGAFAKARFQNWHWREPGATPTLGTAVDTPRSIVDGGVVLPHCYKDGIDIAITVPISQFGGVEKVAQNGAVELKRLGYRCHLFVVGHGRARLEKWAFEAFDTITCIEEPGAMSWDGAEFFGTAEPAWGSDEERSDLRGLLSGMDAVINHHCASVHKVAAALREAGIVMIDYEHVVERSENGRAYGPPVLGLAYEHAYDAIITCSHVLSVWLSARGVPREKLLVVPNAPGYPVTSIQSEQFKTSAENRIIAEDKPLSLLYMGRLDAQKGLHKLRAIADRLTNKDGSPVLTIVGSSVVNANESLNLPANVRHLAAVNTIAARDRIMMEHDVLLLPSLYEGVPLVVLEAQRAGMIVICSDVGGLSEIVNHMKTGILMPADATDEDWVKVISDIANNPHRYLEIAIRAAKTARTWAASITPLAKLLERELAARSETQIASRKYVGENKTLQRQTPGA